MAHIAQLAPHVADLIAAGEVVERPASVVKELVENAVDAGASAVVTEIRGGGMSLIRVTDNGCGIAPGELPTAFLRHATSKLRTEEDLGRIGTLGFRGEALAAISAVSRVDVVTRRTGTDEGASLHLEGGVPGEVLPAGAPEGTTIRVCDLFYNTPARLKFMKKDTAESAAVNALMQHLALSHPEISFKLIRDGEELLHTPGDGKADSAVYAALGREFARTLLAVDGRGGDTAVRGFVTKPLFGRGSRGMQIFFVNGRFIKSQLLTAALEESYRNQMMKGKFPGCVLFVTLPVTAVDVNVHPAKMQVKFAREREVFDAVYHTVLPALDAAGPAAPEARSVAETVNPRQDFFQTMDARSFRQTAEGTAPRHGAAPSGPPARSGWDTERKHTARVADSGASAPLYTARPAASKPAARLDRAPRAFPPAIPAMRPAAPDAPARSGRERLAPAEELSPADSLSAGKPDAEAPIFKAPDFPAPGQETLAPAAQAPWRIAGEILRTYIICEAEDGTVYLIDKHAAHERINFDRLQAAQEPPMRQELLQPLAAPLSREDAALVLDNLALLEDLGFACEDFGGGTVLIRAVPADIGEADAGETLEECAEAIRTGRSLQERRENLLHTMACKAAIKAGMRTDERELRALVDQVQSGKIRYCPHGRPVAVSVSRRELEKRFKRA